MRERKIVEVGGRPSLLTDDDLWLFNEGNHSALYEVLGAHPISWRGRAGTYFAVWAPNAEAVSVVGDFNGWTPGKNPLSPRGVSGIWEGFVPGVGPGALYKYHIVSRYGWQGFKADPCAFFAEVPPGTASVVWDLSYGWGDEAWLRIRAEKNRREAPIAIYEVHLGSWRRGPEGRFLSYRELAPLLAAYVKEMGFTHVEFLPVMEHPFYGSWGYQITGYFSPTARYGTPQDFMHLVDFLHREGIGVILDWVPSHFASDPHGLGFFDGTHLYEHTDPRQGVHPDWGSLVFNYGRHEVRSFLLSSACFWLDKYHADGLRVDAVASMLYLDFSRPEGAWVPNPRGGRENLEAIHFLRRFNEEVYRRFPHSQTYAEESSAWPGVSRPTYAGGLGFGFKWDMGWMHDTLDYFRLDPIHRKYHHRNLTFRGLYAWSENFVLPLSHDEVVHGKGSLLGKMPGDRWQKFANLRLLLGYMYAVPGKKLLFMGGEFGQEREWDHEGELDWWLLSRPEHQGIKLWVKDLNRLYWEEPALHLFDCEPQGFQWVIADDADSGVLAFLRRGAASKDLLLVVAHFTPAVRTGYRVGVPLPGFWQELLNSDAKEYGGSGVGNLGGLGSEEIPVQNFPFSLSLTLPPLGILFLKPRG
ncbi:MAG: 1,4-alpha-glucan branching protein GlgB [Candidatus Bipolaricaulaceae bacterium]